MNPGDVPVFAEEIDVSIKCRLVGNSQKESVMSIGKLCDLLDETGNPLANSAIWINGHSQQRITVLICKNDNTPLSYRSFKPGDTVKMAIQFYQRRGLGRRPGSLEKQQALHFNSQESLVLKFP